MSNNNRGLRVKLRRSHFVVGLAKAGRGLTTDIRILWWLGGRRRRIARYFKTHQARKLQIATSNNILPGWLNTDLFPSQSSVEYLDATKRFPFQDATLDYVFAEHMIEHLDFQSAQFMIGECFRVLKLGGRVRIATPDLRVLLALHIREKTADQEKYIDWAVTRFLPGLNSCKSVFIINNFFRSWGHQFLYDEETLCHALSTAGFSDIRFYRPGVSDDPMLQKLEAHGRELGSEEINQFETIVIEGCK